MILVVRPETHLPDTLKLVANTVHHPALGLPISTVQVFKTPTPSRSVLIFTSAHSVAALTRAEGECICVGEATATAAAARGFKVLHTGTSNANALAQDIITRFPTSTRFTHVHGDTADTTWHTTLRSHGYLLKSVCAYTTTYAEALPEDVLQAFPGITHILLFSAGSTKHLLKLLEQANMLPCLHPCANAVVLSPQVAQAAKAFPQVTVAPQPNLTSLLQTLHTCINAPSGSL